MSNLQSKYLKLITDFDSLDESTLMSTVEDLLETTQQVELSLLK